MEIREILNYLPHRYPFILLDRVVSYEPGKKVVALKNVSVNETYFQGHFPGKPIIPGGVILEALAQAAAILSFKSLQYESTENLLYYFVGIDNARFKKPVTPGDQLMLEVDIVRIVRGIGKFSARALVDGAVVTEADLMCTIREK